MNRLLLALTILRSHLRNGTMTEADFDQAFASAVNYDNGSNLSSDLETLRSSMLQDGADQLRILNRFIHQHQLHETPSRPLRDAERAANRERMHLADQAAAAAMDVARALYPTAADLVLSGSYGNFTLGACRDASGKLIEDSLNDGELTGLNRILSLIRTEPSNGSLVRDEMSGSIRLVIVGRADMLSSGPAIPASKPTASDPVHAGLGFAPEVGEFSFAVVNQGAFWVAIDGQVLEIGNMSTGHVNGVISYLEKRKMLIADFLRWESARRVDVAELSDVASDKFQEFLSREPSQLLEGTALMRALRARVAGK